MKKKFLVALLLCCVVICCLTACEHTHNYIEEIISQTCTERGYTIYKCECGDEYIDNYVDAKHTPKTAVIENEVQATMIADGGYDEVVYCDKCGEEISRTHVTVDKTIKRTEIYSKTLTVDFDNKTVYGKLPNGTKSFKIYNDIMVADGASYYLCTDIFGENNIISKTASLTEGDNIYYIIVENDNDITVYTVTLRVAPKYVVAFDTNGGSLVNSQTVIEDELAVEPTAPTKLGYTFVAWDFDFNTPITQNTIITAIWELGKYDLTINNYSLNCNKDNGSLTLKTTNGATATMGNAIAHSTSSGEVVFDGLVLEGGAGSEFTFLNAIDLSKGYFNSASDYESFINLAFTPDLMRNDSNQLIAEISNLEIILTDSSNPDKFVSIYMYPVAAGEDSSTNVNGMVATKAYNQTYACERILDNALNTSSPMRIGMAGTAATTSNFIYDYANDRIYFQPCDSRGISVSGKVKTLIRDFKKDYSSFDGTATNKGAIFDGFDSRYVNVTIKINSLNASSTSGKGTVVLTKLGNFELTNNNMHINNFVDCNFERITDSYIVKVTYDSEYSVKVPEIDGYNVDTSVIEGIMDEVNGKSYDVYYTPILYNIDYELNGGTNNVKNPSCYTVEDEVNLLAPTKEGYVFVGWSDDGKIEKGSTGDKEFTANWRLGEYDLTINYCQYEYNEVNSTDEILNVATFKSYPNSSVITEPGEINYFVDNGKGSSGAQVLSFGKGDVNGDANKSGGIWEFTPITVPTTGSVELIKATYFGIGNHKDDNNFTSDFTLNGAMVYRFTDGTNYVNIFNPAGTTVLKYNFASTLDNVVTWAETYTVSGIGSLNYADTNEQAAGLMNNRAAVFTYQNGAIYYRREYIHSNGVITQPIKVCNITFSGSITVSVLEKMIFGSDARQSAYANGQSAKVAVAYAGGVDFSKSTTTVAICEKFLAESYTSKVVYGNEYNVEVPVIDGYTARVSVVSGTMDKEGKTINVYYTPILD